jgi:ribosome-associated protein
LTIKEIADQIKAILENKKGLDVEVIDVADKTTLADYFIIASGRSSTQVKALADEVEHEMIKRFDRHPEHIEGNYRDKWVLLDYLDIVVHIFQEEERQHYSLEKLWMAKTVDQSGESKA